MYMYVCVYATLPRDVALDYMSSLSIFSSSYYSAPDTCGLTKLIPADKFMVFALQFFFCHRRWYPTTMFDTDQRIRAGLKDEAHAQAALPCWAKLA